MDKKRKQKKGKQTKEEDLWIINIDELNKRADKGGDQTVCLIRAVRKLWGVGCVKNWQEGSKYLKELKLRGKGEVQKVATFFHNYTSNFDEDPLCSIHVCHLFYEQSKHLLDKYTRSVLEVLVGILCQKLGDNSVAASFFGEAHKSGNPYAMHCVASFSCLKIISGGNVDKQATLSIFSRLIDLQYYEVATQAKGLGVKGEAFYLEALKVGCPTTVKEHFHAVLKEHVKQIEKFEKQEKQKSEKSENQQEKENRDEKNVTEKTEQKEAKEEEKCLMEKPKSVAEFYEDYCRDLVEKGHYEALLQLVSSIDDAQENLLRISLDYLKKVEEKSSSGLVCFKIALLSSKLDNIQEYVTYLNKAAHSGNDNCIFLAGRIKEIGEKDKDKEEALLLFERGFAEGHLDCGLKISEYLKKDGSEESDKKRMEVLLKAQEMGSVRATFEIAKHYASKNEFKKAEPFLEMCFKCKHEEGSRMLAKEYINSHRIEKANKIIRQIKEWRPKETETVTFN